MGADGNGMGGKQIYGPVDIEGRKIGRRNVKLNIILQGTLDWYILLLF